MKNNMIGYTTPNPRGAYNTYRDPYVTNLHTHGLHISGNTGADDVSIEVNPGETSDYTYRMPCDHSGECLTCFSGTSVKTPLEALVFAHN